MVLLAKSNLSIIEFVICISNDKFFFINNVLKEFYDMKEEIKNSNNK